jgi:hypothetical protein
MEFKTIKYLLFFDNYLQIRRKKFCCSSGDLALWANAEKIHPVGDNFETSFTSQLVGHVLKAG